MKFEYKPSFDRAIKSLPPKQKEEIKEACIAFLELLEARTPLPAGLGLTRLQADFWEIRRGIRIRVLFRWKQDLIEFVLAGNHDSIRDFLKNRP